MKLMSWNINGIRAIQKKGFLDWLAQEQPDILGLQEIKATTDQLDPVLMHPQGYTSYWASAERKGYSGVALYSKIQPQQVSIGLGVDEFDVEGRTIVADYGDFVFITAYFPNGSNDHHRVPYKMQYKDAFLRYCEVLRAQGRGIIFCGDVNTAHQAIDLARPKDNLNTTGFLPEERAWVDKIVSLGYVDCFRHLHPDVTGAYTWWSNRSGARERNVGWRIDYFWMSADLVPRLRSARIHREVLGSDHCPVSIELA